MTQTHHRCVIAKWDETKSNSSSNNNHMKSFGCDSKRSFERIHFLYISLINGIIHIDVRIPIFYSVCVCCAHILISFQCRCWNRESKKRWPGFIQTVYIQLIFRDYNFFGYYLVYGLVWPFLCERILLIAHKMCIVNIYIWSSKYGVTIVHTPDVILDVKEWKSQKSLRMDIMALISDCSYLSDDQV